MRFSIINDLRIEAQPHLTGLRPSCKMPVVAKCGSKRINHWAHRSEKTCDDWWEPETEWHRIWKNNFSTDWQEVIFKGEQTGEKHIADLFTDKGLVIEFQHSRIDPIERAARENFYKKLIWVVDGTRLKRDHKRFMYAKDHFFEMNSGSFWVGNPQNSLPTDWLTSPVPVLFDFRSQQWFEGATNLGDHLYCLYPVRIGAAALVEKIPIKVFINDIIVKGTSSLRLRSFLKDRNQFLRDLQNQIAFLQHMQQRQSFPNLRLGHKLYRRR